MNRRSVIAGAAVVLALMAVHAGPASSQAPWELLASKRIDVTALEDTVPVAADGVFTAINVRTSGNELFIESARVVFTNGEAVELAIGAMVAPGDTTREVDLAGNTRIIAAVVVSYRRPTNLMADRTVEVWGRR